MSGVTGYDGSSGSRRWRAHTRAREIPPNRTTRHYLSLMTPTGARARE